MCDWGFFPFLEKLSDDQFDTRVALHIEALADFYRVVESAQLPQVRQLAASREGSRANTPAVSPTDD